MRNTSIEWTDTTWNPIRGCSRVSEGCRNCYAETVANRFCKPGSPYDGVVQIGADGKGTGKWNGQIKFVESRLLDPLKWKKPQRIFVNSMSDLFHEGVTDAMLDKIFAVMALAPQHTFQILTKRPERMLKYLLSNQIRNEGTTKGFISEIFGRPARFFPQEFARLPLNNEAPMPWPLPNVHLAVSVEDQKTADLRIPLLLQTPAAVRFISAEPLLGEITFRWAKWDDWAPHPRRVKQLPDVPRDGRLLAGSTDELDGLRMLDGIIVGGESGPGARPMHPNWARKLRDECVEASTPFFFKQWGEYSCEEVDAFSVADHISCIDRNGDLCALSRKAGEIWWHLPANRGTWAQDGIPDGIVRIKHIGKKAAGRLLDGREWNEMPISK